MLEPIEKIRYRLHYLIKILREELSFVEDLSDYVASQDVVVDFCFLIVDVKRLSDVLWPTYTVEHFVSLPETIGHRNSAHYLLDDLPDFAPFGWLLDDALYHLLDYYRHLLDPLHYLHLGDLNVLDHLLLNDLGLTLLRGVVLLKEVEDIFAELLLIEDRL
jgi:hypothetical protein